MGMRSTVYSLSDWYKYALFNRMGVIKFFVLFNIDKLLGTFLKNIQQNIYLLRQYYLRNQIKSAELNINLFKTHVYHVLKLSVIKLSVCFLFLFGWLKICS